MCCLDMHRRFIYFECKWPKTCAKLKFAYFHPVSVKSHSVKRLPHSKFLASASHLFSITLCLICAVWACIRDLYILNVSGQKLAPKLQFAYLHILAHSESNHNQLNVCHTVSSLPVLPIYFVLVCASYVLPGCA